MPRALLTTAEVAQILNVDRSVIIKMIKAGDITPTEKLPGRTGAYLFDRADIEVRAERSLA